MEKYSNMIVISSKKFLKQVFMQKQYFEKFLRGVLILKIISTYLYEKAKYSEQNLK